MHDPLVVAHEIIRPWPQRTTFRATSDGRRWKILHQHEHHDPYCTEHNCTGNPFPWWKRRSYSRFWRLAGRDFYWPALVTIWHREPRGADSLSVCSERRQRKDGTWYYTRSWRWHVHHWKLQVPPLQDLRRWALTRCAWCGGKSRKGDYVNISHSWDGPRGHWWQGTPGLFHDDCSAVSHAHALCLCPVPAVPPGLNYGRCLTCGKFRPYGRVPDEADRLLASLPHGSRITPDVRPAVEAWAERRARMEAKRAS